MSNSLIFYVSIAICAGAAIIGYLVTRKPVDSWYLKIIKPSFSPPDWIFGPVWSVLYLMMGISLYLVWFQETLGVYIKTALIIFGIQLFLNIAWSFFFFRAHSPLFALFDIAFLWLAIVFTIIYFYPISFVAAWLLVPYLIWVSFASILNYSVWRLNRDVKINN